MMKNCSILLVLTLFFNVNLIFAQSKISTNDLKPLIGIWNGSLTYLDYSSGKPYSMPANIEFKQGAKPNQLLIFNSYPNEPKANSIDTLNILENGKMINNEYVKSILKIKNNTKQIITEYKGTDGNDNKPAIIRHTYTFGTDHYSNRKDVKFDGENIWIKRHEYKYAKTKPVQD